MKKAILSLLIVSVVVSGALTRGYSQTKIGISASVIAPGYYSILGNNAATGYSYSAFYRITQLGAMDIFAKIDTSRAKFSYDFPALSIYGAEIEMNDTPLSAFGKYDFSVSQTASYNIFVEAGISLHNITSVVLLEGLKQPKDSLHADLRPFSYDGRWVPGISFAVGIHQPVVFNISLLAQIGFEALMTGDDYLVPEKKGTVAYPQMKLGIQYILEL